MPAAPPHARRLASHTGDGWALVRGRPGRALAAGVSEYQGYVECASQPVRRREVPHPSVSLILNLGAPLRLVDPESGTARVRANGFAVGLHDRSTVVEPLGDVRCLQVDLAPLAAFRLLGVPMHELARATVELDALLGADARELLARLEACEDWEACFDVLDGFLERRLAAGHEPPPGVAWAWSELARSGGLQPVGELARELGVSRKRLGRQFREYVGLPAKTTARIVRFARARSLAARGGLDSLAALAMEAGYADQAHMSREFRELGGLPPSRAELGTRVEGVGLAEPA